MDETGETLSSEISVGKVGQILGLDSGNNRTIYIEGEGGRSVDFALMSVFWDQISNKKSNVCFLVLHNHITHYQNIARKLGFEITGFEEEVRFISPIDALLNRMSKCGDNTVVAASTFTHTDMKHLLTAVVKALGDMTNGAEKQVCLIIDDVSSMLQLTEFKDVVLFLKYCQSLPGVSLLLGSYVTDNDTEKKILGNCIRSFADITLRITPADTGHAKDHSGFLILEDFDTATPDKWQKFKFYFNDRTFIVKDIKLQ